MDGPKTVQANDNNDLKFRTGLDNPNTPKKKEEGVKESGNGLYQATEKTRDTEPSRLQYITE